MRGSSPAGTGEAWEDAGARPLSAHAQVFAAAPGFDAACDAMVGNSSMCHARAHVWGNMQWPPKGVHLETRGDVARQAGQIYLQAGISHAMRPPPNAIQMDAAARRDIVAWVRNARGG